MESKSRNRQILESGIWVFARKGYRNAGVSDVIAKAGIARGTFYLHFESKQQLFLAIIEDFQDRLVEALESPATDLESLVHAWLACFATHRDQAVVVLREASSIDDRFDRAYADLRASAVELLGARLAQFQDVGWARSDVEPAVTAHLIMGMLDELVSAYVLRHPEADLDALAASSADIMWMGLRARPTAS